jgi:metallo-beta-lactamase family protein
MDIQFLGATGGVTGSCYLIRVGSHKMLLECGLFQGRKKDTRRNREPIGVAVEEIDCVVLSHAHIDHSGRLPLLLREGYTGPVYTHRASRALCDIMLRDSAYLHEKDAEWENRKRQRKGLPRVEPLYTQDDAEQVMRQFSSLGYLQPKEILPGVTVQFSDAGHILGASIVELWLEEDGVKRKLVFSGDLGHRDAPIMPDPSRVAEADLLLLESTYGDRQHRSFDDTLEELASVFGSARAGGGNIIIPAFAVGRTQDLIYLMAKNFDAWGLNRWQVFLDSPMAIQATEVYRRFQNLYDADLFKADKVRPTLSNLRMSRTSEESMAINRMKAGAIIIAGSGMCTGGRVLHHLKHNVWRPECHIVIVGFQAYRTLGRSLVDGARHIKLWGEKIQVNASIHTVGGLSAHADQAGLVDWYGGFERPPRVCLIHGEPQAQEALRDRLVAEHGADVAIPSLGERVPI